MRLLITNGVQQGRVLQLKPGVNRIGRSIDNHLQVPDPSISSIHCEVIFSDAGVLVRDLNSTNGTFIDGEQIQEGAVEIGHGLQLGNVEMRLEEPVTSAEGPAVHVPDLAPDRPVSSMTLEDGSLGCANHPEAVGVQRCTQCGQALCDRCVRVVRRVGGANMIFCSLCNGQCEPLAPPESALRSVRRRRKGFFGRLTQTLKLRR